MLPENLRLIHKNVESLLGNVPRLSRCLSPETTHSALAATAHATNFSSAGSWGIRESTGGEGPAGRVAGR